MCLSTAGRFAAVEFRHFLRRGEPPPPNCFASCRPSAKSFGMPPVAYSRLPWIDHLRTLVILLVVNLHAPVLVALMMLFRPLPQNPYGLALLLTVTGLLASYMLADLARRAPELRAIL